jgi:hypothetical protein
VDSKKFDIAVATTIRATTRSDVELLRQIQNPQFGRRRKPACPHAQLIDRIVRQG